jgi:hypothetical protein
MPSLPTFLLESRKKSIFFSLNRYFHFVGLCLSFLKILLFLLVSWASFLTNNLESEDVEDFILCCILFQLPHQYAQRIPTWWGSWCNPISAHWTREEASSSAHICVWDWVGEYIPFTPAFLSCEEEMDRRIWLVKSVGMVNVNLRSSLISFKTFSRTIFILCYSIFIKHATKVWGVKLPIG